MKTNETHIVTGAFNYTGKYIARRLLSLGISVKTLTGHSGKDPFDGRVSSFPFDFDNPAGLRKTLEGATTFYNTYWIRFPRGNITYESAVKNTQILIDAAKDAGIRKFVHISITNASEKSALPYFKGKGLVEKAIKDSGLSYAIIRPTVIFGIEDILINNIAWLLRKLPIFAVIGSGRYQIRPIFVEDVATIAVDAWSNSDNVIIDAVGPETYTFDDLVGLIADKVGNRARIVHLPTSITYFLSRLIGCVVGDVVLTRDEVQGLMANLLVSEGPATGQTRLSEWLKQNADKIGTEYTSELKRHYI